MKAILISIQPNWVCKIVDDKTKKSEIRKGSSLYQAINKLIAEQGIAPMLIYCTKQYQGSRHIPTYYLNGKVVARFNATADLLELQMIYGGLYFNTYGHTDECIDSKLSDFNEDAQIDNWELLRYTGYELGTQITNIHINDLRIFNKPKELNEFHKVGYEKELTETQDYVDDVVGSSCYEGDEPSSQLQSWIDKQFEEVEKEYQITKAPQSWQYVEVEDEE